MVALVIDDKAAPTIGQVEIDMVEIGLSDLQQPFDLAAAVHRPERQAEPERGAGEAGNQVAGEGMEPGGSGSGHVADGQGARLVAQNLHSSRQIDAARRGVEQNRFGRRHGGEGQNDHQDDGGNAGEPSSARGGTHAPPRRFFERMAQH